jgi:hypothetical protein
MKTVGKKPAKEPAARHAVAAKWPPPPPTAEDVAKIERLYRTAGKIIEASPPIARAVRSGEWDADPLEIADVIKAHNRAVLSRRGVKAGRGRINRYAPWKAKARNDYTQLLANRPEQEGLRNALATLILKEIAEKNELEAQQYAQELQQYEKAKLNGERAKKPKKPTPLTVAPLTITRDWLEGIKRPKSVRK